MSPRATIVSVIAGMSLIAPGVGLIITFVPTRLAAEGAPEGEIGLVVAGFGAGLVLACFLTGPVIRRVGHIRSLAAHCCLAALSVLLLQVEVSASIWLLLRVLHGYSSNMIFVASQSWLNEATPSAIRGRVMTAFYVIYICGIGGGSYLLTFIDVLSPTAMLIAPGCYLAAVLCFTLTSAPPPAIPERSRIDLRAAYRISPVGLVGAATCGAVSMAFYGIGPLYVIRIGHVEAVGLLMACAQAGNLLMQLPLGWLSDRVDRRVVLVAAAGLVTAAALTLAGGAAATLLMLALLFALFAGAAETLYSVSTAHMYDNAEPADYVMVSSALALVWSAAAMVAPLVATPVMARFGADSLFLVFAAFAAAYGVFALWRMLRREAPAGAAQEEFVARPAALPVPIETEASFAEEEDGRGDQSRG